MRTKFYHYLLVGIQFGILGFYLINHFSFPTNWVSIILLVDAIILGIWALISMNMNTLSALPDVRDNAVLTQKGPYSLIRHPMYTSVVEFSIALVIDWYSPLRLCLLVVLIIVLLVKIIIEERILILKFPEYSLYITKTKRLIPWVY